VTLPESPRALVGDGALVSWALWLLAHGATVVITALTIALMSVRLMILWRQWRLGK
jgi:hypothetical protein